MTSPSQKLDSQTEAKLRAIRSAAATLRQSSLSQRNEVLVRAGDLLIERQKDILSANAIDVKNSSTATAAFIDRLTLNPERLSQMKESLRQVALLPDPINETESERRLDNGLLLKQVRSPLGVILMIFESRPNVVTEAFSLAFKSGNALIMRGGSDSLETSRVLYRLINDAIIQAGLPSDVFWGIENPDRAFAQLLMKQDRFIDILVPRGGDSLISYVTENASIPIIKNDRGMCHVYIHEDAKPEMAIEIVANAKTQRPGVCNAMETLLIHEKKKDLLPAIYDRLKSANVQWFVCPETLKILGSQPNVQPATSTSFDTEYLDFKINCRVVSSLNQALEHIERHGSRHSESIITESEKAARTFQNSIDAAAVYWNASTRFTDGFQFGLGGELGISTQKLHVRGPVGLRELTSLRWIIDGSGQIRR